MTVGSPAGVGHVRGRAGGGHPGGLRVARAPTPAARAQTGPHALQGERHYSLPSTGHLRVRIY